MAFSRSSAPRRTTPEKPSMIPSPTLPSTASKRNHFLGSARKMFKKDKSTSYRASSRPSISDPVLFRSTRDDIRRGPSQRRATVPEPTKKSASPADKPLPGLPVASFIQRSPQRRTSLLDALDQPLRRAVTSDATEDWPALEPIRPNDRRTLMTPVSPLVQVTVNAVKPSLGDSIIERMGQLHISNVHETNRKDASGMIPSISHLGPPWTVPTSSRSLSFIGSENVLHTTSHDSSSYIPPRKFSLRRLSFSNSRQPSVHEHSSKTADVTCDSTDAISPSLDTIAALAPQYRMVSHTGSPNFLPHQPRDRITHRKQRSSKVQVDSDIVLTSLEDDSDQPERASVTTPNASPSVLNTMNVPANSPASVISIEADAAKRRYNIPYSTFDDFNGPGPCTDDVDNRSIIARTLTATSYAGTTYGCDEHGSYRMKPVSTADPKHGPRARIDQSADRLLLGSEDKFSGSIHEIATSSISRPPSRQHGRNDVVDSDTLTGSVAKEGTRTSTKGLRRMRGSLQLSEFEQLETLDTAISNPAGTDREPPRVLVIPDIDFTLTAPFLSAEPERDDQVGDRHVVLNHPSRRGLDASPILQNNSLIDYRPTFVITPEVQRAESMPKIASLTGVPTEQLFPPRTTSIVHKHKRKPGQCEAEAHGLNEQSHDHPSDRCPYDMTADRRAPTIKHMQTFAQSAQAHDIGNGTSVDPSSSPPGTTGSVFSNRGRIINNIKGLFHKRSTESQLNPATLRVLRRVSSNINQPQHQITDPLNPSRIHDGVRLQPQASMSSIARDDLRAILTTSPSLTQHLPSLMGPGKDTPESARHPSIPTAGFATTQALSHPTSPISLVSATDCSESQAATKLAYHLLDRASDSIDNKPWEQERLIDLARLLIQAITHCRAAEKAATGARTAAVKAEAQVVEVRGVLADITAVLSEGSRE